MIYELLQFIIKCLLIGLSNRHVGNR